MTAAFLEQVMASAGLHGAPSFLLTILTTLYRNCGVGAAKAYIVWIVQGKADLALSSKPSWMGFTNTLKTLS